MPWRDFAEKCGRDRQWVKTWGHKAHNLGWATITEMPGGANLIVLHADLGAHVEHRSMAGGERAFFTHTDDATVPARAARKAAAEPVDNPVGDAVPVIPSSALRRMRAHPTPDEKSSALSPGGKPGSLPRAYARTREERAHGDMHCGAGEAVDQVEQPVKLARGQKPVLAEPKPMRALPQRPVVSPSVLEIDMELKKRGLLVSTANLTDGDQALIAELLGILGAEQMAWVASVVTRAAVAEGKGPARHIRAYFETWTSRAPVYQPAERPAAAARCRVHLGTALPCGLCATAHRSDQIERVPIPESLPAEVGPTGEAARAAALEQARAAAKDTTDRRALRARATRETQESGPIEFEVRAGARRALDIWAAAMDPLPQHDVFDPESYRPNGNPFW
ncbi:hypothetical protein [Kitasatospora sp. MAP12-9]